MIHAAWGLPQHPEPFQKQFRSEFHCKLVADGHLSLLPSVPQKSWHRPAGKCRECINRESSDHFSLQVLGRAHEREEHKRFHRERSVMDLSQRTAKLRC
jgi:hypothetical protein